MVRKTLRVALACAVVVGVAACGDDDDDGTVAGVDGGTTIEDNVLTISAREYEFDVEGDVVAGSLSIDVTNGGAEAHEIGMARLVDGKTVDDVRAAAEATSDEEDFLDGLTEEESVIDELGGVQAPGTSYSISGAGVEAGDYVLLCFIPNAEGESHYSLGMLTGFTVGEGEATGSPEADATYTITDDGLEGPDTVEAGEVTIEIVNESSVNREATLIRIKDGKTIEDVGAWFSEAEEGPPDFADSPLDFLAFLFDAEQDRTITVDLEPGQWAINTPDPENPFEGDPMEDPHAILFTVS